jgi:hypothetical protein
MRAGEEDEGASRGALTASWRAGIDLALGAATFPALEAPEELGAAENEDEGAGNSLGCPIELLA